MANNEYMYVRKKGNLFRLIQLNESVFNIPDFKTSIPYNGDYKLESEEWFVMEYEDKNDLIKKATNINNNEHFDIKDIDLLVSVHDNYFMFQKVTKSLIIHGKRFLSFAGDTVSVKEGKDLILKDIPDAVYDNENHKLYFKSIDIVADIFDDLKYMTIKEASDEETKEFLSLDCFNLNNDFSASNVKSANRKRIYKVQEKFKSYSEDNKKKLMRYISKYDIRYDEKSKKLSIGSELELKKVLFGIEERLYTTPIGNEKMASNSSISINDLR